MLRGQFLHSIDGKGRVSLPARFRDVLTNHQDTCWIITPALFDPCLHLYAMKDWEEFEKKIADLSSLDPNVVRFRRLYVSAAIECEMDKNGRVLIPPHLRDKASLEREVLLAGMGRWAELWSKAQWDESLAMTNDERELFKKSVTETIRI